MQPPCLRRFRRSTYDIASLFGNRHSTDNSPPVASARLLLTVSELTSADSVAATAALLG